MKKRDAVALSVAVVLPALLSCVAYWLYVQGEKRRREEDAAFWREWDSMVQEYHQLEQDRKDP
jgi:hypothetical protein